MPVLDDEMTPSDFLKVMDANPGIYPEYDALPIEKRLDLARFYMTVGRCRSYFKDGQLVGVGGIRDVGVGEGWFLTVPDCRVLDMFNYVVEHFEKQREGFWRVFAESRLSERFLHHLGFEKQEGMHVWTLTERGPNGHER